MHHELIVLWQASKKQMTFWGIVGVNEAVYLCHY